MKNKNNYFPDNLSTEKNKLFVALSLEKIKDKNYVETKMFKYIKSKITPQNVATHYQLSKLYCFKNISKQTKAYIDCWFTTVADTNNFLELDFELVKKVLLSSDLHITSEIEVFNAAEAWISYNFNGRKKYAKDLLITVRTNLLSKHALKHIIPPDSVFEKVSDCRATLIKSIVQDKNNKIPGILTSEKYSTRYCSQPNFDLLYCGDFFCFSDEDYTTFVDKLDGRNLIRRENVPLLTKNRRFSYVTTPMIYLKGNIYLLDCLHEERINLNKIEKYSISSASLEIVGDMIDDLDRYCVCGFIDKIYFIGGFWKDERTATCRYFDTNNYTWQDVASMREIRSHAACAVFEEKIVVTGGWSANNRLNTAESFDHIANEWTYMPSMIKSVEGHSLVAIKNKLFAIGRYEYHFEVYDSHSKIFVYIKPPFWFSKQAVALGNKIVIFFRESSNVLCYDIIKEEWSNDPCYKTTDGDNYFEKIPKLSL